MGIWAKPPFLSRMGFWEVPLGRASMGEVLVGEGGSCTWRGVCELRKVRPLVWRGWQPSGQVWTSVAKLWVCVHCAAPCTAPLAAVAESQQWQGSGTALTAGPPVAPVVVSGHPPKSASPRQVRQARQARQVPL